MKVVVQRVLSSSVTVDGKLINQIDKGLNVLVGFSYGDTIDDINYLVKKVTNLRIFDDENGVMNKSVVDVGGSILAISQFTLYGDAIKGNRPSYIEALKGEEAFPLYEKFCEELSEIVPTYKGVFGADMKVSILNDGPVTILIESKK
ncbi:MAG: D-tyrosyl-tRNA(Tyr) deacylase [Bacilli bacterium]|nr:D-tyrosyl-tRNA(Tyr) deacylase [Bacilli bacterium]